MMRRHADRVAWELAADEWNSWLQEKKHAAELPLMLQRELASRGCVYRFSRQRFEERAVRWNRVANSRPANRVLSLDGDELFEIPVATTLRPAFLPSKLVRQLKALATNLENIIQLSNGYLNENASVISLFGDPIKGEFDWIQRNRALAPLTQWVRIDYIWKWRGETPDLKMVDVNLLPGMTFINETISKAFSAIYQGAGAPSQPQRKDLFNTQPLCGAISEYFTHGTNAKPSELRLAVLTRNLHGLGGDSALCARRLREIIGCGSEVVTPRSYVENVRIADSLGKAPCYHGIVRMARPVSKHAVGDAATLENEAFRQIMRRITKESNVFPSFTAYLENHIWFYIWQTKSFERFARARGVWDVVAAIRPLLPRTQALTASGILLDQEGGKCLAKADLKNQVLKRGNSTGGQNLVIMKRPSSSQLDRAFAMMKAEPHAGWVVQELIEVAKEFFPVCNNRGTVTMINGFMVHGAYFSAGRYMGGHAVTTPTSRKVHGGFDSYVAPAYTSQ